MAEDLLQPKKNVTPENIGCAYFDELVARSFFQPSSTNEKLFVMHDLMHDLASFCGEKFYFKLKQFVNQNKIDSKTRHLSYATKYEDNRKLYEEAYNNGAIHMRTFLDFFSGTADEVIFIGSDSWLFQQQFQCLRVLSFQCAAWRSLPNSIELGELIHLRYLNLSNSRMVTLSQSICKLHNLQTLKLAYCRELEMLPNRMKDLVNLRHLDIRGCDRLKKMPKEMSKLKHLNFLSDYIIGDDEENGIRELEKLDNLHGSFWISNLEKVKNSDEASKAKMGNKKHIDTFKLKWLPDGDIDDVETERDILDKLQPHQKLKELSIEGYRGETFPDWLGLSAYSNMTKLTLNRCRNCCELPALGWLPFLQHLELARLHGLKKIDFEIYNKKNASAFKSLETLKFELLSSWREWHFPDEFDGFPRLRILEIRYCHSLSGDLPAHLPALDELTIVVSEELACSLPRAPKLHQLFVKGSTRRHTNVQTHTAMISESKLANSVLKSLPDVQTCVQSLRIRKCWSLDSISADYLPASLQYLEIFNCSSLRISEQMQHKWLTQIYVDDCNSLTSFPLGDLPNLKKLLICNCPSLKNVVVTQALPSLSYLSFSSCPILACLPALGFAAPNLEKLNIYDCEEIDCFGDECLPQSLKNLRVDSCHKLVSWIASNGLQSEGLTYLKLDGCFDVMSFPREGLLPASLESLDFSDFPDLEMLDCKGLHHLTSLKELSIRNCAKLENITEANSLASIASIYIGQRCPLRTKLEEMEEPRIRYRSCIGMEAKSITFHFFGQNLPPFRPSSMLFQIYLGKDFSQLETQKDEVEAVANIKWAYRLDSRNWQGDPCALVTYKWQGVECSSFDGFLKITSLNLSSSGLTGHIPTNISKMTMLKSV
ncbi:hypothetical protein PIB30_067410 [Stylosanthes scabra]|uniref:Uncharacterized protein n=1 Tax=Stylosanthes scabra TaxID=79078 RepID=A0ABU6WQW4_9FABA|nr:hypothetical protein [Stylosanthes scabra]